MSRCCLLVEFGRKMIVQPGKSDTIPFCYSIIRLVRVIFLAVPSNFIISKGAQTAPKNICNTKKILTMVVKIMIYIITPLVLGSFECFQFLHYLNINSILVQYSTSALSLPCVF